MDKKKRTLKFDFAKAVRGVIKDHPHLARNTFFVHAGTRDCLTDSPLFRDLVERDDTIVTSAMTDMEEARKKKTSFAYTDKTDEGDTVHVLIFHPDKKPLYAPRPGGIDDAGSFDHETGHILASDMKGVLGENLADSYAMLRHLQRFGADSKEADYCGFRRAVDFIMTGIDSHVTTFSVDKILIDSKAADFISLSPRQTLDIAKDYARQNTPSKKEMTKVAEDFKSVAGKDFNQKRCQQIAKITLQAHPDSATFYLGKRILTSLWQPGGREVDGKKIELKGAAWDKIRGRIEAKASSSSP
jgi:hypothetical protein